MNILFPVVILLPIIKVSMVYAASYEDSATVLSANVGSWVVFDCPIDFPHGIVIPHMLHWNKDGELIFSWSDGASTFSDDYVNRISLLPDYLSWDHGKGSINLTNIRESDQGWYECKVYFPNRTPSTKLNGTWFLLNVEGGSLITIPPTNETVIEEQPAKLRCVSKTENAKVTWFRDETPVQDIPELRDRARLLPEGSLNIASTSMTDSGYYVCQITSTDGEKQTAGAYLNIQYKAKVIYAPKDVHLPYGRPATLECYFKANPEVTKVRWEKDGFLFDAYNVPGVFSRKNGTLYFSKVDETHSGEYTCTPYNELGTDGPSPKMNVIVQRPPIFTVTPHILYLRKIGESIVMTCDAINGENDRRPSISWFRRDGNLIPEDRASVIGGNLTISDIHESDRGVYQCIASNEAATISSEAELMIENMPPKAPYNVTANVTQTSITVKWEPGFVKPKLEYSVWYRSSDTTEWRTLKVNSRTNTEAVISNLSPEKEYEVMVLSQDQHGDGMFSKAIRVKTKSERDGETDQNVVPEGSDEEFRSPVGIYQQIGPPYDIYVQVVPSGYKVHWKSPKYGKEMLKYYTVVWYDEEDDENRGNAETADTSYIIKNLDEEKTYIIQILAMSTNDYESSSSKYIYHVPAFHKKGAIFIGAASGVFIVTLIISIVWYVKKKHESLDVILEK